MPDADPKNYRRRHRVTQITERRVYRTVVGLRRRVLWRLRELSEEAGEIVSVASLLRDAGQPMRKDSMWHTINRRRMDRKTFELLTDLLRMDEVDGWDRPWPKLPPVSQRRSLADVVTEELTAERPGKD
jgi:hypothetical protein